MWPFSHKRQSAPRLSDVPFGPEYLAILDDLHRLKKSNRSRRIFGAATHRLILHPPLLDDDILAFEARHDIRLPDDYRGFLLHVGNGGAGPAHGLFKLGEMDEGHATKSWDETDGFVGMLSKPFPHTNAWNDLTGQPEIDDNRANDEAYEDAFAEKMDAWEEAQYRHCRQVNGAIPICHEGCAIRLWLVVTGPERGHIWRD